MYGQMYLGWQAALLTERQMLSNEQPIEYFQKNISNQESASSRIFPYDKTTEKYSLVDWGCQQRQPHSRLETTRREPHMWQPCLGYLFITKLNTWPCSYSHFHFLPITNFHFQVSPGIVTFTVYEEKLSLSSVSRETHFHFLPGMEDGRIPDSAISASSTFDQHSVGPHIGRVLSDSLKRDEEMFDTPSLSLSLQPEL